MTTEIKIYDDVCDQANQHIAVFTLKDEYDKKIRAEKCKCSSCRADYQDALDRVGWATDTEKWTPKKTRVVKGNKEHYIDGDDFEREWA